MVTNAHKNKFYAQTQKKKLTSSQLLFVWTSSILWDRDNFRKKSNSTAVLLGYTFGKQILTIQKKQN